MHQHQQLLALSRPVPIVHPGEIEKCLGSDHGHRIKPLLKTGVFHGIPCSSQPFSFLLQASFTSVPFERRRRVATDEREIGRRTIRSNTARIIVKHDVQHPGHRLHAPVTPNACCELAEGIVFGTCLD